jgi:hypothetical protein
VATERAEALKQQLARIHRSSVIAETALSDTFALRNDYDKEIRSVVSEEGYQRYREYEEGKPAKREYTLLAAFAKSKGIAIDSASEETILGLIRNTQAYSAGEWWHGPFDGPPNPAVGNTMVSEQLGRRIGTLEERSALLHGNLSQVDLPEQVATLLREFYSERLQELNREFLWFQRPEEDIRREMKELRDRVANSNSPMP